MNIQKNARSQPRAKKFYKPLLILALFTVFVISSTTAYFTSSSQSDENIFTSGDLKIEVTQDNVLSVNNWFPGDSHTMEFSVTNTGSMAEFVKGYLGGSWGTENLDNSVFEITKLERKVNDTWIVVDNDGLNIDEEFYFSSDGTENTLLGLDPGGVQNYRLSVLLNETTGDEYQNEIFSTSLHFAAKQTVAGAGWPESY